MSLELNSCVLIDYRLWAAKSEGRQWVEHCIEQCIEQCIEHHPEPRSGNGRPGPSEALLRSYTFPRAPSTPTRRHALGRLPTPPPLPENLLSDCTENCPLSPLRAPRRFRNPRFPFTSTPSPPASLAIGKAPSASVESIEPRPPRPCEVGRPKGRRRKSRRQSHKFFKHRRSGWHPNSPPRPGGAPHPPPPARKRSEERRVGKERRSRWAPHH